MRNHVFCQVGDPYLARRGHNQAVEPACSLPCEGGIIRDECRSAWIKAQQQPRGEGGRPDDSMGIAGNFHQRDVWPGHGEKTDAACGWVEATKMVAARLGEPDHALWINGYSIGKERLHALFGGKGILLRETGVWIEPSQAVGVELGEPDHAVAIQHELVGGAWERQRLARVAGVRDREGGQGIHLVASRRGEVVTNVVGVLLHKPDRIIRRDLHSHDPIASVRRCHLLEGLRPRVEDSEVVLPHFPKPDSSFVINREAHDLTIGLWEGVLTKHACCCDGRGGRWWCLRRRRRKRRGG